ncbi:MAG: hypothetical protein AAF519_17230 [Bacteroidota bacterium]
MKYFQMILKGALVFLTFMVVSQTGFAQSCQGVDNCPPGDDCGLTTYYRDQDRDGRGNAKVTRQCIDQPAGYVSNPDDCDDTDPKVWNTCGSAGSGGGSSGGTGSGSSCTKRTWYVDLDGDGWGMALSSGRNQNICLVLK